MIGLSDIEIVIVIISDCDYCNKSIAIYSTVYIVPNIVHLNTIVFIQFHCHIM